MKRFTYYMFAIIMFVLSRNIYNNQYEQGRIERKQREAERIQEVLNSIDFEYLGQSRQFVTSDNPQIVIDGYDAEDYRRIFVDIKRLPNFGTSDLESAENYVLKLNSIGFGQKKYNLLDTLVAIIKKPDTALDELYELDLFVSSSAIPDMSYLERDCLNDSTETILDYIKKIAQNVVFYFPDDSDHDQQKRCFYIAPLIAYTIIITSPINSEELNLTCAKYRTWIKDSRRIFHVLNTPNNILKRMCDNHCSNSWLPWNQWERFHYHQELQEIKDEYHKLLYFYNDELTFSWESWEYKEIANAFRDHNYFYLLDKYESLKKNRDSCPRILRKIERQLKACNHSIPYLRNCRKRQIEQEQLKKEKSESLEKQVEEQRQKAQKE